MESSLRNMRIFGLFKVFRKVPYGREALQAGLLMGAGDLIAQKLVEKKSWKEIDRSRVKRFFTIGTLCVGPPLRFWYGILHKHVKGGSKSVALKKVVLDQIAFAPVFMLILLTIINISGGYSIEDVKNILKKDYPDILKNNYLVWPAVQLINFHLIPLRYQVAAVQVVALFWNTYISWKTNNIEELIKKK